MEGIAGVRRKHFSYEQKQLILREHTEEGVSINQLSRKYQIHPITVYTWRRMINPNGNRKEPQAPVDELLRELETLKKENKKLKHVVAELSLDKACQKDIIEELKKKQFEALSGKSTESS